MNIVDKSETVSQVKTEDIVSGFYVEGFICLGLFQLQKRPDYEYGHWHAGREVVTVTQITEWSKKTGLTGWCLLTGYYPDADTGVVVVDADTPEAIAWCEANLPKTPMVVRSAKGVATTIIATPGRE